MTTLAPTRPVVRRAGLNPTLLRLELRRVLRNRRTVIFTLVMPVVFFLIFGLGQGYIHESAGRGNVTAYVMISMALYGAMIATTSGGAMVSVERASGWSRQLRLTPLSPTAYIAVKLVVAMTLGLVALAVVYAVGACTSARMDGSVWVTTAAIAWLGSSIFAAFGLFMGYLLPSENVMQLLSPGLALLAFGGGLFIPLEEGSVWATIAQFTHMYGIGNLVHAPLTGDAVHWTWIVNVVLWLVLFVGGAVWLVFLVEPLAAGWDGRDRVSGWVGMAATVFFAVYFLRASSAARQGRLRRELRPPLGRAVIDVSALTVLAVAMTVALGEARLASTVFLAVTAMMSLPVIAGGAVALGVAGGVELLATRADWNVSSLPLAIFAASFVAAGVMVLMNRNIVLLNRRDDDERRAVQDERTRVARDLHDILGHSLTVITVKAQLANRLLDVDIDRARTELDDLERLSRDALTDVRSAVEGLRGVSLPVEIARAREALRAAGVEAQLPHSTDTVPTHLRELFAWSIREAVTNVVRHSEASRCTVTIDDRQVTVADDGIGTEALRLGNGLNGLRERAAQPVRASSSRILSRAGSASRSPQRSILDDSTVTG